MSVKQANVLGLMTRLSAGALLATQLTACSALGLKTPGEMWSSANDPRDEQSIDGPRRLPKLNKELLQASQTGRPTDVEALLEQDKHVSSGVYIPLNSGASHAEPPAVPYNPSQNTPALQQPATSNDASSSTEPNLFDRMGSWFSSGEGNAPENIAQPNETSEGANDEQVSMQNTATMENIAIQSGVSNSVAVPNNSAGYRSGRKRISGNPTEYYATPGAKLDAPNYSQGKATEEHILKFPKSSKPKPDGNVSLEETPVALRPDMRTEIIEDDQLFNQSLAHNTLSKDLPLPENREDSSVSAVIPLTKTREEDTQAPEVFAAETSKTLPTIDPNSESPYPPLSSVPPTPTRLNEVRSEAPQLQNELMNEGDVSKQKQVETEAQQKEEAPGSLQNMPLDVPASMDEEPLVKPSSLNEENTQSFAVLEPSAGNSTEQLLAQASDTSVTPELTADEKTAVNVLDNSLASPVPAVDTPTASEAAPVNSNKQIKETTATPEAKAAEVPTKKREAKKKRAKKHVSKRSKSKEPKLSHPLDYSTVKPLMLPESYRSDANTTANIISENHAAAQSPAVETLMTVNEALAQQYQVSAGHLVEVPPLSMEQPVPALSVPQEPQASVPRLSATAGILAPNIILPPAQFDQPVAMLNTSTPMPVEPPLAPVAANEFLLSRIARQFVGIFSVVPDYAYLPVLNENRTVQYLPDSRYAH